ncbi:MAG: PHP domain-containing protein, partial [Spirochaetales bacterium]|nr:PHP domain-containing protein [Spirochaetales bacterium]
MKYRCDLHIHTCLSPCGSLDSSPLAVVSAAAEKGLKVIAVCDHNSALNCKTAMKAGKLMDILVIPGIEVATRDEAHILALFPSLGPALELGAELYRLLPPVPAGNGQGTQELDQVFVDLKGVILGEVDKFLAAGADIGIEEVVDFVHKAGGLVIPAHIDRPVFSVISQLGFLPDLPFDAVEIAGIKG